MKYKLFILFFVFVFSLNVAVAADVSVLRISQIVTLSNTMPYSSLSADEQTALTAYLTTNSTALTSQSFQTFAPGSVFAWALGMGTGYTLNDAAKSLGFTTYNPVSGLFVTTPGYTLNNPIFTSNASGVMYVGDSWNIVITGLNPNETIYATGGKKVNGVVPTDKTPYTADNFGIYTKTGSHASDVVGDWQIVWTRANGAVLGTLTFSVQEKSSSSSMCTGPIYSDGTASQACATLAEAQGKARGYSITCASQQVGLLYAEPNTGLMYYYNATCKVNGIDGQGAQLLAGYTGYSGTVNGRYLTWSGNDSGWNTFAANLASGQSSTPTTQTTPTSPTTSSTQTSTATSNQVQTLAEAQRKVVELTKNLIDLFNKQYSGATVSLPAVVVQTPTTPSTPVTTTPACSSLDSNLSKGSSGSQVTLLTQVLVKEGLLSAEQSTFDQTVFDAVVKYQEKYASDILTPVGLTSGTGFVGASTRTFMNSNLGCTSTATGPLSPFRYLKVETTVNGWVSWREIEIYDDNGQKITPISATASDTYGVSQSIWGTSNPTYPQYVYDGDYEKVWNAGETNPTCRVTWSGSCPESSRSAWITVDLGSVKNVSKIRLMKNGDNVSHSTRIYIGTDNISYTNIATFNNQILDRQWLEYPSQYTTPPEITLTVNGSNSTTISAGRGVYYKWDVKNADSVTVTYTKKLVKAPTPPLSAYVLATYCAYKYDDGTYPSQPVPFSPKEVVPLSGDITFYLQPHDTFTSCPKGYQFDVTFKATQSISGKSTTKTVSITVGEDIPPPIMTVGDIFSGYVAPSSAADYYDNKKQTILHPGESGLASVVGYQAGCKDIYNPVRDTSVPTITLGNIPAGVTANLDPVVLDAWDPTRNVCEQAYYRTKINAVIGSDAKPGFNFIRVYINGKYAEYGLNVQN